METVKRSDVRRDYRNWERLLNEYNRAQRNGGRWYRTPEQDAWEDFCDHMEQKYGMSGSGLMLVAEGFNNAYNRRDGTLVWVVEE